MENSNFQNNIKKYLEGDLSPAEMKRFQQKIATDPDFAEEVKLFDISRKRLLPLLKKYKEIAEFRRLIEEKSESYFEPGNSVSEETIATPNTSTSSSGKVVNKQSRFLSKKMKLGLAVAASLLVLVMLTPVRDLILPPKLSPTALYENLHQLPESSFLKMNIATIEGEIDKAFNAEEYEKALDLLNQYLATEPENTLKAQFFKGLCLQKLNRHQEAIAMFKPLSEGNSSLKNDSHWYIALSYLYEEEFTPCRTYLNKISKKSSKHKDAQYLLNKLPD